MASLNLKEEIEQSLQGRIESNDQLLGKDLLIPQSGANSGSRKLMHSIHIEQHLPLLNYEVPIFGTGYETQFGEYSSSYRKLQGTWEVLAKIPKFSWVPEYHYFLLIREVDGDRLDIIERKSYTHVTESYGYLHNNTNLDRYKVGDMIETDTVIKSSSAFDEYGNRMDGINLNTVYLADEYSMEDGIIISESAAKKLVSPLIKNINIIVNDNDIPLNIYGEDSYYKSFPDIGEDIKGGILCAMRRESKDTALYLQSYNKLKNIMISDDKYTVIGRVVDIDVHVNNPARLQESQYYIQIKKYYDEHIRFCNELVNTVLMYTGQSPDDMSYDLQKLFYDCSNELSGKQFVSDKVFGNTIMDIIVIEENEVHQGDKISNRYGCKGVISKIYPDDLMPQIVDTGERAEVILNMNTVTNREDPGQLFELSVNYIGKRLIEFIREYSRNKIFNVADILSIYLEFIKLVSPKMGRYTEQYISSLCDEDAIIYASTILDSDNIYVSVDPANEIIDIDKIKELYDKFDFIADEEYIRVPILDSNNNIRYTTSRRPVVMAKQYFYRLKQYAEEKFSVTNLSSTNIRNENTRNKMNNVYKSLYARTPIRFGDMELGDLLHAGAEIVTEILMLYSTSPHARRLAVKLLNGDPFNIDIKLDNNSKNRNVEIINAYMKTLGLKFSFERHKKKLEDPLGLIEVLEMEEGWTDPLWYPDPETGEFRELSPIDIFGKAIKKASEILELEEGLEDPLLYENPRNGEYVEWDKL